MKVEWIPEKKAAEMLDYKPETLRRNVLRGKIQVAITNNGFGRKYKYNKLDIDKLLMDNSTIVR